MGRGGPLDGEGMEEGNAQRDRERAERGYGRPSRVSDQKCREDEPTEAVGKHEETPESGRGGGAREQHSNQEVKPTRSTTHDPPLPPANQHMLRALTAAQMTSDRQEKPVGEIRQPRKPRTPHKTKQKGQALHPARSYCKHPKRLLPWLDSTEPDLELTFDST